VLLRTTTVIGLVSALAHGAVSPYGVLVVWSVAAGHRSPMTIDSWARGEMTDATTLRVEPTRVKLSAMSTRHADKREKISPQSCQWPRPADNVAKMPHPQGTPKVAQ
jgi:hypothetical protein